MSMNKVVKNNMTWKDNFPKENRFFETENGILYNGNSYEILKDFPVVDLLLTDPPYGIIQKRNNIGGYKRKSNSKFTDANTYKTVNWDITPTKDQFNLILSKTKNQIIFGYNYFTNILPPTNSLIIWDKKGQNNWFSSYSDGEIVYSSFKQPLRIYRFLWQGAIRKGKNREKRTHITEKPVELLEWILFRYLRNENFNIVLDTFAGSGSTLVACEKHNIKWIGIEIDTDFCENIKQRLIRINDNKEIDLFGGDV